MTEPGIHEKMGPNDDYEAKPEKVENPLERAAFGPAEPAFPDLTDPAVRRRLRAEIERAEAAQPSPHRLDRTVHGERLNNAISLVREAHAEILVVLADPQVRGVPRDNLQLTATELNRSLPRLQRAYSG